MSKYVAGTVIALGTTFGNAFGLTLQKQAHVALEKLRYEAKAAGRPPPPGRVASQKRWLIGLAFMSAASVASLAVFALVGQSVASTFASITIIWNLLLSITLLGEKGRKIDVAIAGVMILGAVLAVVFGRGGQTSGFLTVDDLLVTLQRTFVYVCFGVYLTLIIALAAFIAWADAHVETIGRHSWVWRSSLLARAVNAGIFSGFVGFFSKGSVNIFAASISHGAGGNLNRYEPWLFLVLLPVSLVFQVLYLNSALKHFRATEAVPLYQSQVVLWGVLFGVTLYAELSGKSASSIALFIVGIVVIMLGIGLVFIKQRREGIAQAAAKEALLAGHAARAAKRSSTGAAARRAASFWDEADYQALAALGIALARWGLLPLPPQQPTAKGAAGSGGRPMQLRLSTEAGGGAAAGGKGSGGKSGVSATTRYRPLALQAALLRTRAWSAPPAHGRGSERLLLDREAEGLQAPLLTRQAGSSLTSMSKGPVIAAVSVPEGSTAPAPPSLLPPVLVPVRSPSTGWSTLFTQLTVLQLLPDSGFSVSGSSISQAGRERAGTSTSKLPPPAWLMHKLGPQPFLLPRPVPPPPPQPTQGPEPPTHGHKRPLSAALAATASWWTRTKATMRGPAFGWKPPLAPELSPTASARQEAMSLQHALTGAFNATYGNGVVIPEAAAVGAGGGRDRQPAHEAPVMDAATLRTLALADLALSVSLLLREGGGGDSDPVATQPEDAGKARGSKACGAAGVAHSAPPSALIPSMRLVVRGRSATATSRCWVQQGALTPSTRMGSQQVLRVAPVRRLLLPLPGGTTAAAVGPFIRPRRVMSVSLVPAIVAAQGEQEDAGQAEAPPPPTSAALAPLPPLPARMPVRLTTAPPPPLPPQEPLLPSGEAGVEPAVLIAAGSSGEGARLSTASGGGGAPPADTLTRRLAAALKSNLALVPALGAHSGWDVLPPDTPAKSPGTDEQVSVLPSPWVHPRSRAGTEAEEEGETSPAGSRRSRHSQASVDGGGSLDSTGGSQAKVAPILSGDGGTNASGSGGGAASGDEEASSPDMTVFTSPQLFAYAAPLGTGGIDGEGSASALFLSGGPSRRLSDFTSDAFPLSSREGGGGREGSSAESAPPPPPPQPSLPQQTATQSVVTATVTSSGASGSGEQYQQPEAAPAPAPTVASSVLPCLLLPLVAVQHLQFDADLLRSAVACRREHGFGASRASSASAGVQWRAVSLSASPPAPPHTTPGAASATAAVATQDKTTT